VNDDRLKDKKRRYKEKLLIQEIYQVPLSNQCIGLNSIANTSEEYMEKKGNEESVAKYWEWADRRYKDIDMYNENGQVDEEKLK